MCPRNGATQSFIYMASMLLCNIAPAKCIFHDTIHKCVLNNSLQDMGCAQVAFSDSWPGQTTAETYCNGDSGLRTDDPCVLGKDWSEVPAELIRQNKGKLDMG